MRSIPRSRRLGSSVAVFAALVIGLGTAAIATATTAGATAYHPVYKYADYIGGHGKADDKLSPVVVGVVNNQDGTDDPAPEWTIGAEIAEKFINQHAHGVDGHPIELKICSIPDTPAQATTCGEEFANDKAISVISAGAVAIGNEALESAILPTKKPIIFGVSLSPVDTVYKYGYILYGDSTHIEAPIATFAKEYLHVKSVSLVWEDEPGESSSVAAIVSAMKYLHITVDEASFDPSDTDLTEPLEAAQAGKTGLTILGNSGGPACSDFYFALKQLAIKTKVLVNVPCDTPDIQKADGGQLPPDWYYASANPLPGDTSDPSLAAFKKVATEYGEEPYWGDAWVADSFGQMITIAKFDTEILKAGKKITPATVNATAKAFKGPVVQGAPDLDCGGFKGAPAVCNDKTSFFQNTSPGVFHAIVYYLGPPAGFKVTG